MIGKFSTSHGQLTKAEGIYYPMLLAMRCTKAILYAHTSFGMESNRYVSVCAYPRDTRCLWKIYEKLGTANFSPEKENTWLRKRQRRGIHFHSLPMQTWVHLHILPLKCDSITSLNLCKQYISCFIFIASMPFYLLLHVHMYM